MAHAAVDLMPRSLRAAPPHSPNECHEMIALGIVTADGGRAAPARVYTAAADTIPRRAIESHDVLNDATDYPRPSSFSRGVRFDLGDKSMLLISGTASIDHNGLTSLLDPLRRR